MKDEDKYKIINNFKKEHRYGYHCHDIYKSIKDDDLLVDSDRECENFELAT